MTSTKFICTFLVIVILLIHGARANPVELTEIKPSDFSPPPSYDEVFVLDQLEALKQEKKRLYTFINQMSQMEPKNIPEFIRQTSEITHDEKEKIGLGIYLNDEGTSPVSPKKILEDVSSKIQARFNLVNKEIDLKQKEEKIYQADRIGYDRARFNNKYRVWQETVAIPEKSKVNKAPLVGEIRLLPKNVDPNDYIQHPSHDEVLALVRLGELEEKKKRLDTFQAKMSQMMRENIQEFIRQTSEITHDEKEKIGLGIYLNDEGISSVSPKKLLEDVSSKIQTEGDLVINEINSKRKEVKKYKAARIEEESFLAALEEEKKRLEMPMIKKPNSRMSKIFEKI